MLEVKNATPFMARLFPWLDVAGTDHAIVVLKATFALSARGLSPADEQVDVQLADVHFGDPASSSVRYASDVAPEKRGTDVAIVGAARAARPVTALDLDVRAGPLRKALRVTGDRAWERGPAGLRASAPRAFVEMPLVWERAFGGVDASRPPVEVRAGAGRPTHDPRNPVGVGFATEVTPALEGKPLPNVEDPAAPLVEPAGAASPAGVAFTSPGWLPRARAAGTLDEAWRTTRAPLLPLDFDVGFFHAAAPGLTSAQRFSGGEVVAITSVTADGSTLAFEIPRRRFVAHVLLFGRTTPHPLALDTVLVEPDLGRVLLTYRALVPCPRAFLAIDRIRIAEERA
jgi:hypothetical protein